jgi:hypothetical protein
MGRKVGGLLPLIVAAAVVVGACGWAYSVWKSPQRNDLAGYGSYALALAVFVGTVIAGTQRWFAKARISHKPSETAELDDLADQLAAIVKAEWTDAAGKRGLLEPEPISVRWRRPLVGLVGPISAAVESRRFSPLPGMSPTTADQLDEGEIDGLHQLYGGLGSGRLVITGDAGSGKSGAAVLLVLAALKYRDEIPEKDRTSVPVPVMFTLHGWDPATQSIQDWLAIRLGQTYPILSGSSGAIKAAQLIVTGNIVVILDGLDEIPERMRPIALQALSQQAAFRLIILARHNEMVGAAAQTHLQGAAAIELCDVDPITAADYLTRVQLDPLTAPWRRLMGRLRHEPDAPLARALNNPLTVTLLRDTYREGDDLYEFLDFSDHASSDDIVDHLLDCVLPAAYDKTPGHPKPRYDLQTAQRALRHIAAQMNAEGTRDLQWWYIPRWASRVSRALTVLLVVGLGIGLAFGLILGLQAGLLSGTLVGIWLGIGAGSSGLYPERIIPVRWQTVFQRKRVLNGIFVGVMFGAMAGLAFGLVLGVQPGLVFGLMVCAGGFLAFNLIRPGGDLAGSVTPLSSWQGDRAVALILGLAVGLLAGLLVGLRIGFLAGILFGVAGGVAFGFAPSEIWPTSITFAQLAMRWHSPIRIINFLEDARERNILRTIGPVYQFRHARLQDHLAEQLKNEVSASPQRYQTGSGPASQN